MRFVVGCIYEALSEQEWAVVVAASGSNATATFALTLNIGLFTASCNRYISNPETYNVLNLPVCINDVFFESVPFPLYLSPSLCTAVQTTRAFAILGLFTAPVAFALRVTNKIPLATAFYFVSSEIYDVSLVATVIGLATMIGLGRGFRVFVCVCVWEGGGGVAWVAGFFSRI